MISLIKYCFIYSAISLLLLVGGSAWLLATNKLRYVEVGLSEDMLEAAIHNKVGKTFTVFDPENGEMYQVRVLPVKVNSHSMTNIGGISYKQWTSGNYLFLSHGDLLVFRGFPRDFLRSEDRVVKRLTPIILGLGK